MKQALDLQKDSIIRLFMSYLLPAIASGVITSLYIIVDGIFIGKGIGSQGLAAVGLVVPMFTMFSGLSLVFGIGGSTQSSIAIARGNNDEASKYFTHSVLGITVLMTFFIVLVLIFKESILTMFGAQGELLELSSIYLSVMILFGIPYALALVLSMFVRVEGFPKLAMTATVIGALINVVFDYVFIFEFKWGIFGAALATGMGNIFATAVLLVFFLKKKGQLRFIISGSTPNTVGLKIKQVYVNILAIGAPTFLDQAFVSIIIIVYNKRLMNLIGEAGVSAYSAIGFLMPFSIMIFVGIAQALQPIISANYGSRQIERINEAVSIALKTGVMVGLVFVLAAFTIDKQIMGLFISVGDPAYEVGKEAFRFYFASYLFVGVVMVINSYFQSIEEPKYALYLTLLRGAVIIFPAMFLMSNIWHVSGMWYAVLFTEVVTMLIAIYFKVKHSKSVRIKNDSPRHAVQ